MQIGRGDDKVTHNFHSILHVGKVIVPKDFYVMNGKSSRGIVLGYGFLATQDIVIAFGSRQVTLRGKQVPCMENRCWMNQVIL